MTLSIDQQTFADELHRDIEAPPCPFSHQPCLLTTCRMCPEQVKAAYRLNNIDTLQLNMGEIDL
jgi:hypothetical protein